MKKQISEFWSYILWLVLMSLALVSTARGEDRALLIGVGRYAHFDDRLNGVDLDLDMMTEIAQLMGFEKQTIKILDHERATTANVYHTFENWLINGTGPPDRVLIYFSGHGSQVPDDNHDEADRFDEVLLLHDTTLTVKNGRQTLDGVLHDDRFGELLAQLKSRHILIILDACHSGSATRSLRLAPRTIPVNDAQVKYFYYSPLLEAAGSSGQFDVMAPGPPPDTAGRYVALAACRDDERTVATSQGSIFTLGLRQAVRAAARAGKRISPDELQRQAARFIQHQIGSDGVVFHPQIAGHEDLRRRPLQLLALSGASGVVRRNLAALTEKSQATVRIKANKTCFEPGDVLELTVTTTEAGYLNIVSVTADDRPTVLFPNRYHPNNAVSSGHLTVPGIQMGFELISDGPPGPQLITAFLTRTPENSYRSGFKSETNVMADLSLNSTRALVLRQKAGYLAAGRTTVEIRPEGHCQ